MRRSWLILAALAALALSACGGKEKQGERSATPTAGPAATGGALDLGQPAPAFTLQDSAGQTVSLADYRGQPVLLFFHMADG